MEQQPMPGVESLEPPTSEVAQRYLDLVDPTVQRRSERTEHPGRGWSTLVNAVAVALIGVGMPLMHRSGTTAWSALFLCAILIASRLVYGAVEGRGVRWRFSRGRLIEQTATILALVAAFASVLLDLRPGADPPFFAVAAPALVGILVLLVIAAVQFSRGRDSARLSGDEHAQLSIPARWTTVGLGAGFGLMISIGGIGSDLAQTIASVLALLLVIAAAMVESTGHGLTATGVQWRWPQFATFAVTALSLFASVTLGAWGLLSPLATAVWGVSAGLLLVVASALPGRKLRG